MPGMSVVITDQLSQTAVSIRAVVENTGIRDVAQQVLPEIEQYIAEAQGAVKKSPFLRYHRFDGHEVMVEVGYCIAEPLAGSGRIQASGLPGGPVALFRHQGPFSRLIEAYGTLQLWMEANQATGQDAPWEMYRDVSGLLSDGLVDVDVCWPVHL